MSRHPSPGGSGFVNHRYVDQSSPQTRGRELAQLGQPMARTALSADGRWRSGRAGANNGRCLTVACLRSIAQASHRATSLASRRPRRHYCKAASRAGHCNHGHTADHRRRHEHGHGTFTSKLFKAMADFSVLAHDPRAGQAMNHQEFNQPHAATATAAAINGTRPARPRR